MAEAGEVLDIIGVDATREWLAVCCVPELAEGEDSLWVSAELVDGDFAALVDAGPDAALRVANDDVERTEDVSAGGAAVVQVDADLVNVRSGPGTNYPVVATAGSADAYTLNGRSEDGTWLQVCCLGAEQVPGWISGDFVTAAGIDAAAVVAAPPLPEPASAPVAAAGQSDAARLAAAPAPGIPGAGGFGAPGGANPLTGLGLDGGRTGQRPLIVCINNDFAARPQLGISQADIMYEYLMEGYGITRFSGVFYGDEVGQIGPVRSARLINYYMGALFEAGLACSGASDGVRYTLKEEAPFPYMDIDLDDPSNARYSVSVGNDYRTRLRTSSAGLRRWLADWGVEQPAAVRGFSFGATPEGGVPATTVNIPYPRATASQVSYRYDPASGRYLRSLGDAPHLDGNSGAQVGVENVIVQYVPHETTDIVEDSLGSLSIRLNLFGSGRSIVLRDGVAYEGEWRSESRGDLPRFYAEDGREIPLKPGRTWVSVVPFDYGVSYQ